MARDLTRTEEKALRRTLGVFNAFQQHNPTMPIQVAASFLLVALNEGKSLRELCDLSGVAQSTMSRHLLDLGEHRRSVGPVLGLVKGDIDPMELRRKQFRLTPKGRVLLQMILAFMETDDEQADDCDRRNGSGEHASRSSGGQGVLPAEPPVV